MNESLRTPEEFAREITREEAASAYKMFIDQGITNPDDLDLDDPKVREANKLFYMWQDQEDKKVGSNEELRLRNELKKTMFYVDAGFTDKDYLDEVLNDWLEQENVSRKSDNPERNETRRLYHEAKNKIRELLKNEN
jgi:hypothetical protein